VSMDAVAALGWYGLLAWGGVKLNKTTGPLIRVGGVTTLILLQLASAMSFYPYYYTYSNPIMKMITGHSPVSDYGEGFEQAAVYLAQKPNSESFKVLAYHGRGPFSYFFPGETDILNLLYMVKPGMGPLLERMVDADYLVINDAVGPRSNRAALFVDALSDILPEHVIQIKGVYTIRIYRVEDLTPGFYETISK